jgi:hypothetical protein
MPMSTETIAEAALTLSNQIRTFYGDVELFPRRLDPKEPRWALSEYARACHMLALLELIPTKIAEDKREQAMRWLCWCQGVCWEMGLVTNVAVLKAANAPADEPNEDAL